MTSQHLSRPGEFTASAALPRCNAMFASHMPCNSGFSASSDILSSIPEIQLRHARRLPLSRFTKHCGLILALLAVAIPLPLLHSWTVTPAKHGVVTISTYILGETLENYSGGFVRRGLLGAIIQLATRHGSAMLFTAKLIYWNYALYFVMLTLLIMWRARFKAWTLALILLMPGGLYSMACTHEYYGRKEMFLYCGLAALGLLSASVSEVADVRRRRVLARFLLAAIWAYGFIAPFGHEGFIYLCAAASAFLLANAAMEMYGDSADSAGKVRRMTGLYVAMNVALLLLISALGHPTPEKISTIWNSFSPADRALFPANSRGGLDVFAFPMSYVLGSQIMLIFSGWSWYYFAPVTILLLYCASLVSLNAAGDEEQPDILQGCGAAYLTILICSAPLFLLAMDYGRWLNATPVTFLIVWLSLGSERLSRIHLIPWHSIFKRSSTLKRLAMLGRRTLIDLSWTARRHTGAAIVLLLFVCSTSHLHELAIMVEPNYIPHQIFRGMIGAFNEISQHSTPK